MSSSLKIRRLEQKVRRNDKDALFELANILVKGDEQVQQNAPRAVSLYETCVRQGHAQAMYHLAVLLQYGAPGVEKDPVRAKALFEDAIRNGYRYARNSLAVLLMEGATGVQREPVRAKSLYEHGLADGDTTAVCNLANLLMSGAPGFERDSIRAKELFEDAARGGDLFGKHNLATLLSMSAGSEVEKDVERSKVLYEEVIEKAGSRLQGGAMANYGHLLMVGYGKSRDLSHALNLFQSCVDKDLVFELPGLALLLWKGGDGIERNITRSKQLLEDLLHHRNNFEYLDFDLGSVFQFLLESADDVEAIPIPLELYILTNRPARHFANLFLGFVLLEDLTSQDVDVSQGLALFETFVREEYDEAIIQFVKTLQCHLQESRFCSKYPLQASYGDIVRDPGRLSKEMIISQLTSKNISSMNEVIAGHNLLCFARKQGLLTDEDSNGSTDLGWHIQDKFYFPASRLKDADEELLNFIFRDAQVKGIIPNGYQFVISNVLTSDMELAARQINDAFKNISKRFQNIEENHISTLSRDLNKLYDLFKKKNKVDQHTALASCMLSFIPIIGKSIGESAKIAGDLFIGLGIEDGLSAAAYATEYQMSTSYSVDLSDFRTAFYMVSEKGPLSNVDEDARQRFLQSVEQSKFKTLTVLQEAFLKQIRDSQGLGKSEVSTILSTRAQDEPSQEKGRLDEDEDFLKQSRNGWVGINEDSRSSFEHNVAQSSIVETRKTSNKASGCLVGDHHSVSKFDGDKSNLISPSTQLIPFMKALTSFGEMIIKNKTNTTEIIDLLLSGFLSKLEQDGIINKENMDDFSATEFIALNDESNDHVMETHEMEAMIKSLFKYFTD